MIKIDVKRMVSKLGGAARVSALISEHFGAENSISANGVYNWMKRNSLTLERHQQLQALAKKLRVNINK